MVTASAHPAVMTIQPELCPLVRCSTTLATTPSPSTIRIAVPKTSARMGDMALRLLVESEHVPVRIGEARSFFRSIGARRPDDATALSRDGVDRLANVIDHYINQQARLRGCRSASDPRTADSTDGIV